MISSHSRRVLGAWAALAATGCVQQDHGLEITVEVALGDLPTDPVPTLAGALPLTDARLRVQQLVLEPCPDLVARSPLSWLLGTAQAHGTAQHADGALIIELGAELTPGATIAGTVSVPPEHPICAVELRFDASESAALTVLVDDTPRRWAPPVPDTRWAIAPLALDTARRAATVSVSTAPAHWLAPFGPDGGGDRDAPLSVRLAAGVTESFTLNVR